MTTNLWVEQYWRDYKLQWDPEEYGGELVDFSYDYFLLQREPKESLSVSVRRSVCDKVLLRSLNLHLSFSGLSQASA